MTQVTTTPAPVPDATVFREWLRRALFELNTAPSEISIAANVSINTAGNFIRTASDVRLGTAHSLHSAVLALAAKKGVELPSLGAEVSL